MSLPIIQTQIREPFLEPFLRSMRVRKVLSHIPKDSTVLDVGCGFSGAFLRTISPHIKQGFGVDFKVNNMTYKNITMSRLKFDDRLDFADSSFDIVTMLAVLEHIEKEKEILAEIHRVLIPGGKLILTVPSVWSQPILEFLSYKLKIVNEDEILDHKRYYNRKKLKTALVQVSGFKKFYHKYFQFYMNNFCLVEKEKISVIYQKY